jgi:DNA-directed RNA polymerase I subunit RPA2
LTDGTAKLMFNVGRELFYVPVMMIMKALIDATDEFIYKHCVAGCEDDLLMTASVTTMLRQLHREGLHTHSQVKAHVGEKFRAKIVRIIGEWATDTECCEFMLDSGTFIQCNSNLEKFHILVLALQKMYSGVQGNCAPENADHVMLQEVILGGHLYLQLIKDKLANWMQTIQYTVLRKARQQTTDSFKPSKPLKTIFT